MAVGWHLAVGPGTCPAGRGSWQGVTPAKTPRKTQGISLSSGVGPIPERLQLYVVVMPTPPPNVFHVGKSAS
jgi:hypothetical protein